MRWTNGNNPFVCDGTAENQRSRPVIPLKNKKIQKKAENGIAKRQKCCIVQYLSALVAQLDRAIASGAIGREFEPRRVHHFLASNFHFPLLFQAYPTII